jgi:hypothetical protein
VEIARAHKVQGDGRILPRCIKNPIALAAPLWF